MATAKELILINQLREDGRLDNGQPSFLRDWEPVRFLGRGSFGEVYEIRRGNERCALKIIAMDDEFIEHYAAEIDALERIKNEQHAVRIHEYAIINIDRGPYVQKYMLIRMNLLNKLPRNMDEDQVIDMGVQLCDILAKCHSGTHKIYHCDIKPENILVTDDGTYKLSDFGAAKISDKTHNSSGFRGTPLYMSPEMGEYRGYDNRSDLYSLGVTMYALLNKGFVPFYNGTNSAQAIRARFDGRKPPQIEGVSEGMMNILCGLMEADPDRRYKTAQELSRDLQALATERKKQREAEDAARKRAQDEARKQAEEEARKAAGQAADAPVKDIYAETNLGGKKPQPVPAKRKPFGIIATAAALVAAIVCGVIWLPGTGAGKSGAGSAAGDNAEHLTFEKTDGGYKVTFFDNTIEDVVIPTKYDGEPVVQIGDYAFTGKQKLKSVYIPDGVTNIGNNAFDNCKSLASVRMPDGVTDIGDYAFRATALTSVTIPDCVTSIGNSAFESCVELVSLTIPDGVTSIGDEAFSVCFQLDSVTIPDSVESIGRGAFGWCGYINVSSGNNYYKSDNGALMSKDGTEFLHCSRGFSGKYIIPYGVTSIDEDAFTHCYELTSVTIPDSVTNIGGFAFSFCDSLTSVTIPDSVTSIGDYAFNECDNLTVTAPHDPSYYGYTLDDGVNWNVK